MHVERVKAHELLNENELAVVRARSDLMGLWCAAHAWAVIAGAMALFAWWPNPITFLFGVIVIGSRQLGLAILMHDGAHGTLAKTPWLNDFLSQWLCAYPVLAETFTYRKYHLKHHARTQQKDDPDLELSAPFPITRASFRRKIIRDLTGQTAFQQRRSQFRAALGKPEWPWPPRLNLFARKLGPGLGVNLAMFAVLAALGVWWVYPLLWVLPFMTWMQVVLRVRNIAEHAIVPDNNDPYRNARTTLANWWERAILAPYWVNYHVEHHLLMWVPCYRLPAMHKMLAAKGITQRMEIRPNYLNVLKDATARGIDADGGGERRINRAFEGDRPRAGISAL